MKTINFSTVLASAVHDIKNALNILINNIDAISNTTVNAENKTELEQLQYQGKRINNHLIQLLVLYRINQSQYFPNLMETGIKEFLDDATDQYTSLFALKNITLTVDCADDLYWYIDCDLINGVLTNIMNNLYMHAKSKIEISARLESNTLILQIKDDGPGFSDEMMLTPFCSQQKKFNFNSSSTGLGLYFSSIAAEMHQNNGKSGYISTSNDGLNGGGCFSIMLP